MSSLDYPCEIFFWFLLSELIQDGVIGRLGLVIGVENGSISMFESKHALGIPVGHLLDDERLGEQPKCTVWTDESPGMNTQA